MLLRGNMAQFRKGAVARAVLAAIHDDFRSGVLPAAYAKLNRGGQATRTGPDGLVGYGPHNLLPQSETFSGWAVTSMSLAAGAVDPLGGTTAYTITATGANADISKLINHVGSGVTSMWIRRRTGIGAVSLIRADYGSWVVLAVTNEWVRYSDTRICSANAGSGIRLSVSGDAVDIWHPQFETGIIPGEYLPTTTSAHYPPRITYDPTTLACRGMLVEGQASDTAQDTGLNAAVTAAQNRTVTATPWTVQFHGTGTITLSGAHTAVITGTGPYQQKSLTFTPSAGTLTMTPAGDVKNLDLINQAYPSSSIVNTTAGSAVRPADPIVLNDSALADRLGATRTSGTVLLDLSALTTPMATGQRLLYQGLPDQSRRIDVYSSSGALFAYVADGASYTNNLIGTPSGPTKLAVSWDGATVLISLNGAPAVSIASVFGGAAMLTHFGVCQSGAAVGGTQANGIVRTISYWQTATDAAALQALTA